MKKISDRKIAELVKNTLQQDFNVIQIVDVRVFEDVDSDGDDILRIEVVFDGEKKKVDARAVSGAVRHVRPKLFDMGELAFPLFSFVSNRDPGLGKLEPA